MCARDGKYRGVLERGYIHDALRRDFSWHVFTPFMRAVWTASFVLTILLELTPIPPIAPAYFYTYCASKLILFMLVGYFAPLAFWPFNNLNRAILLGLFSAGSIELTQGILRRGHRFVWYELAAKVAIIVGCFVLALVARHNRRIAIGSIRVQLQGEHLAS